MAKSDNWATPPDLMRVLDREFKFDLEVCAAADNRALPHLNYLGLDNGLDALKVGWDWEEVIESVNFCNPPYSMLPAFADKAGTEVLHTNVLLIPAYMGTNYFQEDILKNANEVRILKGRLTFWEGGKPGPYPARFDSAVVVYRPISGFRGAIIREWDWRANLD